MCQMILGTRDPNPVPWPRVRKFLWVSSNVSVDILFLTSVYVSVSSCLERGIRWIRSMPNLHK